MGFWSRFKTVLRKGKLDRDMAEQMRIHLAQRAAEPVISLCNGKPERQQPVDHTPTTHDLHG
jgi:hypothetical protein